MDGQQAEDSVGPANAPSAEEIAKLGQFLGVYTDADRPGVHGRTGQEPDNVRPLASRKRDNPTREVD